jgi:YebC/PmpR family DNA-binding regulatory protein
MSGHSKWANIKHKKSAQDAKKSRSFSTIANVIALAAKQGNDPDPKNNPYLREAVGKAKGINMPQSNIERAIKRGLGLLPGIVFEELVLEAYGPGGIALLIRVATDNRNRTVSEIRKVISDFGGNLGGSGSVLWMFREVGKIEVAKDLWQRDSSLSLETIDVGAEEIVEKENIIIFCPKEKLESIKKLLTDKGIELESEIGYWTENQQRIADIGTIEKINELISRLEERDDVISVYSNAEL